MKTWIKRIVILVLVLVTLVVGSVATILFTPLGLSIVLGAIPSWFPELTIESSEGSLLNGFQLRGVSLQLEGVDLKADHLRLDVDASCLMNQHVCINRLESDDLQLKLTETGTSSEPSSPITEKIHLPLSITLASAKLNQVNLDIFGTTIAWKSLTTSANMEGSSLILNPTYWDQLVVALPNSSTQSTTASVQEQAHDVNRSKTDDATESKKLELPNVFIPLDILVKHLEITQAQLHLPQEQPIEKFVVQGDLGGYKVNLKQVELLAPQGSIALDGHLLLFGEYPLTLNANSTIQMAPLTDHQLSLQANGDLGQLTLDANLSGKLLAKLKATTNVLDPQFPFDVSLQSQHLQWPIESKADFEVKNSSIKAKGDLSAYDVTLATTLSGKEIPTLGLRSHVKGNLTHADLKSFTVYTLGGQIKGHASVDWEDTVSWNTKVSFSDIQPHRFKKDIEGNLSGEIQNHGELTQQGGWAVAIPKFNIHGHIFEQDLSLEGDVKTWDHQGKGNIGFSTKNISLFHADNRLNLKGEYNDMLALDLALDIDELSSSLPDAQGVIKGHVKVEGTLDQPIASAVINGQRLKWQDLASIEAMNVRASVSSKKLIQGSGLIELKQIKVADNTIEKVTLRGSGDENTQTLGFVVDGAPVEANIAVKGQLSKKQWQGRMHSSSLTTPVGKWRLEKDLTFTYDLANQSMRLSPFCWMQLKGKVCSDQEILLSDSGSAQLTIRNYNLAGLHELSPEIPKITSLVNAKADVAWFPNMLPRIQALLQLGSGTFPQSPTQPVNLGWDGIQATLSLIDQQLKAGVNIALTNNGDIRLGAQVKDVSSEVRDITTHLKLDDLDLSLLAPLLGEDSQVKGMINGDVKLSGDVRSPQVAGFVKASDLVMKSTALPVAVNHGEIDLRLKQKEAQLFGNIQTSEGELVLTGDAKWRQLDKWFAHLNVKGEELAINLPSMVSLKVSPNMTLKAQPDAVNVTGNVYVPWGRILVESLPASAVTESSDLVILNDKLEPVVKEKSNPLNLNAEITVSLGDDVKLEAFGLSTLLEGKLNVISNRSSPQVSGEINLEDGTYRSFGQDLLIKKGQILFNGAPTEPYLQVEAIRNPDAVEDNVEAGILVTGPAAKPELTIFSKPAMPQANALSYLVRGTNLNTDSDNSEMTSMLIGLGLSQSGKLVGQIGEAFGVQDLSIDTAGIGDEEKVEVSGYILPGLQVKYGVGIFTGLPEFTLRYKLMKNFYVEAVSGLDNSVDVLYQFTVK